MSTSPRWPPRYRLRSADTRWQRVGTGPQRRPDGSSSPRPEPTNAWGSQVADRRAGTAACRVRRLPRRTRSATRPVVWAELGRRRAECRNRDGAPSAAAAVKATAPASTRPNVRRFRARPPPSLYDSFKLGAVTMPRPASWVRLSESSSGCGRPRHGLWLLSNTESHVAGAELVAAVPRRAATSRPRQRQGGVGGLACFDSRRAL
jgi:hypothetical protein